MSIVDSCLDGCYYGLFLFFKQKTAYAMRISDWSADVCSSDLELDRLGDRFDAGLEQDHAGGDAGGDDQDQDQKDDRCFHTIASLHFFAVGVQAVGGFGQDRKSVVSGKSVSVRVELGGRRIIKQKQHTHTIQRKNEYKNE